MHSERSYLDWPTMALIEINDSNSPRPSRHWYYADTRGFLPPQVPHARNFAGSNVKKGKRRNSLPLAQTAALFHGPSWPSDFLDEKETTRCSFLPGHD